MTDSPGDNASRENDCTTLATLLREGPDGLPAASAHLPEAHWRQLHAAAQEHGVSELLGQAAADWSAAARLRGPAWLPPLTSLCEADLRGSTAMELLKLVELRRVLNHFAARGIEPLILKGTSLAYGLYASPALRPRGDTDLLMPPGTEAATRQALVELHYACDDPCDDLIIVTQGEWKRVDSIAVTHCLDIHRTSSNAPLLAAAFVYADLLPSSIALPELSPHARGLNDIDALLLACVHRAGTLRYSEDKLIWHADIHKLFMRMTAATQQQLVQTATTAGLKALCHDALTTTVRHFGTPVPDTVLDALQAPGPREPAALCLGKDEWRWRLANWASLPNWRIKARWLKETAFPSAERLQSLYPEMASRSRFEIVIRRAWRRLTQITLERWRPACNR